MKVTRRGQVTIPKSLRESTGIDEGSEIDFHEEDGCIVIVKVLRENPFQKWVGFLGQGGDSDEIVRKMRGHP